MNSRATRRYFLNQCSMGVGAIALNQLLAADEAAGGVQRSHAMAARPPHFAAKAKRIIYLFMAGGPSQLETFDYKPKLNELSGQPIPASFVEGKRFAFMDSSHRVDLLGSRPKFAQFGQAGTWVSDYLPHTAGIVDDLCMVKTCKTDLFNHAPAKLFMNTGSGQFGRPSMGAWVTYGLGSVCEDLPGFVVLQSGPRGPRGGAMHWTSGGLATSYQGVPLRNQADPILNLSSPHDVSSQEQRRVIDTVNLLNQKRLLETGDDEIATRMNAYEMAFRMQTSAPELMETTHENADTLAMYGIKDAKETSYARNCLLARRLVERGVRFVQLYHTNWDHHGGPTENLETHLPAICKEIDQATAGLIRDLKQRGLLEDTLVIWGGEFGRTPMGELRESTGRNHHIDAFTMWFAGGGMKPGYVFGETDEFGFGPVGPAAHVRDLHATILNQLGLHHERLSIKVQGLDMRLTGVEKAHVLRDLLA